MYVQTVCVRMSKLQQGEGVQTHSGHLKDLCQFHPKGGGHWSFRQCQKFVSIFFDALKWFTVTFPIYNFASLGSILESQLFFFFLIFFRPKESFTKEFLGPIIESSLILESGTPSPACCIILSQSFFKAGVPLFRPLENLSLQKRTSYDCL